MKVKNLFEVHDIHCPKCHAVIGKSNLESDRRECDECGWNNYKQKNSDDKKRYQLPDKTSSKSPQEYLNKLKAKLAFHKKEHEELSKELKHQYTLGPNQLSPQKMDRMVRENNEHIEFINKLTKEIKEFEERNR